MFILTNDIPLWVAIGVEFFTKFELFFSVTISIYSGPGNAELLDSLSTGI